MESTQENPTPSQSIILASPETGITKKSKFDEFVMRHQKEIWFGMWNNFLYTSTLIMDNPTLKDRPIPTYTEGLLGFIEQNMAGSMEVVAMFYLARIPVSLVARGIEIMANKKIDPRIKIGASVFLSVAASSALELMTRPGGGSLHGGIPDPLDAVGNVVAGIYIGVGHQVIDYLFQPRETPLFEQWWNKVSTTAKSHGGFNQRLLGKIDKWVRGLPPPVSSSDNIAIVQKSDVPNDRIQDNH